MFMSISNEPIKIADLQKLTNQVMLKAHLHPSELFCRKSVLKNFTESSF